MKCAVHLDRQALGYCSRCGKPLCKDCLVRLRVGNFCDACANAPEGRLTRPRRGMPWWAIGLIVLAALIAIRMFAR
ncbi:MAG: hypothetical protein E6H04_14685 [Bacillati bacterium ANGP1]|uniref:B box-type domain-containing protein n=1 Tax=Candidatus Segetimicrobium genomatis TaxID=2569760 RepID=A0A537J095_9BACT|nr:MAG: hypothetical protein E6H04_14685 [Terrabacteria group bacterium ANGP1]